jgi:hypothetical protein
MDTFDDRINSLTPSLDVQSAYSSSLAMRRIPPGSQFVNTSETLQYLSKCLP